MNNKGIKIFLYFIFISLIAGSAVLLYFSLAGTKPVDPGDDTETSLEEIAQTATENIYVNADVVKMSQDVDLAAERKKHNNPDIIGRLEIPDLFNVLLVKTTDNKYYLNKNIDRKNDIKGSTYLDYRTGPASNQINIYGHNSRIEKIDVPFRRLEKFLNKDFFDKNPYIVFQYDGGKRVYKITSIKEIHSNENEHMKVNFEGQAFVNHIEILRTNAINKRDIKISEDSRVIVLQTCSHHWKNAYYIITGVSINFQVG